MTEKKNFRYPNQVLLLTVSFVILFVVTLTLISQAAAQTSDEPPNGPSGEANTCYDCHIELEEEPDHVEISEIWAESVHGKSEIGCAGCHGGDPTTDEMSLSMSEENGYVAIPPRSAITQICGGCHSDVEKMRPYDLPTDQLAKYTESVHGIKLAEGDANTPVCSDCHGVHDVKSASDPSSKVYPLNVPELCGGCHSDAQFMESYDIPTDQYDVYKESVHGELLLNEQDVRAPSCASCHGSHAAKPPTDAEVADVCGVCHTATKGYYEESLHSRIGDNSPRCWTCHGTHDVTQPDETLFIREEPLEDQHCGSCHLDDERFRMDLARFDSPEERRCGTCHHEESRIMVSVKSLRAALSDATQAYTDAEDAIQEVANRGMIVSEAEAKLTEAFTSLVRARAMLHTTKLPVVTELTDEAIIAADMARSIANEKLGENVFRRQAMVVWIGVIVINISALVVVRRNLYHQLDEPDEIDM